MRDAAINLRALPEQRDLIDHAATLLARISHQPAAGHSARPFRTDGE